MEKSTQSQDKAKAPKNEAKGATDKLKNLTPNAVKDGAIDEKKPVKTDAEKKAEINKH